MLHSKSTCLALAFALTVVGCGGDDDTDASAGTSVDSGEQEQEQEVETPSPTTDAANEPDDANQTLENDSEPAGESAVAVPIARFTAHGPQAANTIGPACAEGIDTRGGDVFRFTPPAAWAWQGTGAGTSYDEVTLVADDVRMTVTEAAYDYEKEAIRELEIVGPSGVDVDIDGETIAIMQVMLGGASGYAIVDLPYLGPLPTLDDGALGTVLLTSDSMDRPTVEEATELLGSVRIERCAAVGESMIWGPAGGVHLVPRFEPDPLGKAYPDQPQPAFEPPQSVLDAYSLEQVAYLMPVDADVSMCAAAKAVEFGAGNPIGYLFMFLPNGTNTSDLDAIVAAC